jgi:hypothetical protein
LAELSLVEFLQIFLDFAKNLRSLSIRINNKSKKRKGIPVVSAILPGSMMAYTISRLITEKGIEFLAEIPELSVRLDVSRQLLDNYILYPEFIDIMPADKT